MAFVEEFEEFLTVGGVSFVRDGLSFLFPDHSLEIVLVPIPVPEGVLRQDRRMQHTIHLFEDRWRSDGENLRKRVMAHLGRFRSIFARNCSVRRIDAIQARPFLEAYHSYGHAKCAYYYGLYHKDGELVAVSAFSEPRRMVRDIGGQGMTMDSYEWVRFASLPDCRISGGMGKMLKAFEDEVHPLDIMSYADLEWSDGEVYRRLGFEEAGFREPVRFYVDTETWQRISVRKFGHDRAYRNLDPEAAAAGSRYVLISNLGSVKYIRTEVS